VSPPFILESLVHFLDASRYL